LCLESTGDLTLDFAGDANAVWTFNIGGTLNTAANSEMIMDSVGRPANVHWNLIGAISHGADSKAIADMKASGQRVFNLGTVFIFDEDKKGEKAEWTFTIGGALTTAAGSKFLTEFTNGKCRVRIP
jgi:hypothetical protein